MSRTGVEIFTTSSTVPITNLTSPRQSQLFTIIYKAFVFCAGDCPFESEPTPPCADACGKVTGCDAGYQEISRCSTRGGSWGIIHYIHHRKKANSPEPIYIYIYMGKTCTMCKLSRDLSLVWIWETM